MTITWVTGDLSAPARAGGELRSLHLLRALSAATAVRLALLDPRVDARAVREATGVLEVRQLTRWAGPAAKRGRALRHRWPLGAAAVYEPGLAAWVRDSAAGGLTLAEHVQAAPYLAGANRAVLSLHNDDARVLEQGDGAPTKRLSMRASWERRATRRLQDSAVSTADLVVCVSARDRDSLQRPDALVVPNGADVPARPPPASLAGSVLFVGSMNYPPNCDAVRWWLSEVSPLLPGDLRLTVVGRRADDVLPRDPRLHIFSDVDDVAPHLEQAGVVVLPLRFGGGSRLKLLEAMAWSRPVVSTRKGAEGFAVRDGEHLLLADGAAEFAAAVTRLREDRGLAERLAVAGRRFAEAHDWSVVGRTFVEAVMAVRERSAPAGRVRRAGPPEG